jgi:myo-inositol-1(or 4)-monophosphatase
MLTIAVRAARKAGDLAVRYLDRLDRVEIGVKGHNDYVTEVDRRAEQIVIQTLQDAYPDHAFLGEESGQHGDGEYVWIIDPLDGTTNYLHGFPQFAVSIALQHRGVLDQAVVYDPLRAELFTASRGAGAQLNNRKIRVSRPKDLQSSLLGTGLPFRDFSHLDEYLKTLRHFMTRCSGVRRAGAASLDLAYVASGRLDGFWEYGLKSWDLAAGALLITEAGGLVGDLKGADGFLESGNICAGTPAIYEQLIEGLAEFVH